MCSHLPALRDFFSVVRCIRYGNAHNHMIHSITINKYMIGKAPSQLFIRIILLIDTIWSKQQLCIGLYSVELCRDFMVVFQNGTSSPLSSFCKIIDVIMCNWEIEFLDSCLLLINVKKAKICYAVANTQRKKITASARKVHVEKLAQFPQLRAFFVGIRQFDNLYGNPICSVDWTKVSRLKRAHAVKDQWHFSSLRAELIACPHKYSSQHEQKKHTIGRQVHRMNSHNETGSPHIGVSHCSPTNWNEIEITLSINGNATYFMCLFLFLFHSLSLAVAVPFSIGPCFDRLFRQEKGQVQDFPGFCNANNCMHRNRFVILIIDPFWKNA